MALAPVITLAAGCAGCAVDRTRTTETDAAQHATGSGARVVVVAPVLDLSGGAEFDSTRLTDVIASEFLSFPEMTVVPVNLVRAALARRGKSGVEHPSDAIQLAREFSADMAIVVGVTEFDPYDPPLIGMIMQAYGPEQDAADWPDAGVPREVVAGGTAPAGGSAPRVQVQRVFNGSADWVVEEVKSYAAARDGERSVLGWRRHLKSQELFARYCAWSLIRSILEQDAGGEDAQSVD